MQKKRKTPTGALVPDSKCVHLPFQPATQAVRYLSVRESLLIQEETIIDLLRMGDERAFRLVYDQNQKTVINICYRFVRNREAAEDLTQEVFLEVFRSIRQFRKDSRLSTWIYRIATTRSIDYVRGRKAKKRSGFLTSFSDDVAIKENLTVNDRANPEKSVTDEEARQILYRAIDELPENQRIAFVLGKHEGLSHKEIAEILDTSLSAVESLVHRAKKNLEKKLYRYFKDTI
jgi:RNA polymerase sigma-70 factor (ECF subfamily)